MVPREAAAARARGCPHAARRQGGFTLVEMMLASAILLVILAAGASLAGQASAVWRNVYHDTRAVHDARQGLARVAAELRQSSRAVITVAGADADADALTYQVPVGRTGTGIVWGADKTEGWRVQVAVQNGRLLRTVRDAGGQPRGRPEVLATNVDGALAGVKGFSVAMHGPLAVISLRTQARTGGHSWRRTVTTTVRTRNSSAAAA